ncbi:MAG: nitroreductase family protein [Gemmatimonadota bacterium]|nr:nitroreductase family protein [Gemmatimonadota bacterium]
MSHLSRVFQLLRNRQAIRGFEDRPVPLASLARILDCGRYAPSAKEDQPWTYVVVQDPLARVRLAAEAFHSPLVRSAPVLIIACARIHSHVSGHGRPSHPIDVAAGVQSMALAAADLGLAAVWITGYREPGIRKALGIPGDVPIVAMLTIGYPDGFAALPERRPEAEVVAWEHWPKESNW